MKSGSGLPKRPASDPSTKSNPWEVNISQWVMPVHPDRGLGCIPLGSDYPAINAASKNEWFGGSKTNLHADYQTASNTFQKCTSLIMTSRRTLSTR